MGFRRFAAAPFAALIVVLTLTACGSGWPTDQRYNPGVGVNNRDTSVNVLNAMIVSGAPGSGNFVATLVNTAKEPDQLSSVEVEGLTVGGGAAPAIAPEGLINLASAYNGIPVTGDAKILKAGAFVRVKLTFTNTDPVTLRVPIVPNTGPHAELAPSASPSA